MKINFHFLQKIKKKPGLNCISHFTKGPICLFCIVSRAHNTPHKPTNTYRYDIYNNEMRFIHKSVFGSDYLGDLPHIFGIQMWDG